MVFRVCGLSSVRDLFLFATCSHEGLTHGNDVEKPQPIHKDLPCSLAWVCGGCIFKDGAPQPKKAEERAMIKDFVANKSCKYPVARLVGRPSKAKQPGSLVLNRYEK